MGVGRDAGIAAGVASGVCVVGVDVVFPVLDTGYFFGAIGVGAGVPVGCFVFAPIAVSMGMGRGAGIAAGVASGVGVVGVDVVFPVLDTGCFFGAIRVGTGVPVRGFVRAPIAVGMGVGKGAGIAADVAGGVGIAVVDVEIRQFALLGVGAGFVCADTRMAGFAVGGPGAVGVGMGGVRGDGAFIAADVAGGIGVAVVDVGCAVHFRLVWAVLGGADAIVALGVIFPAVKGVGMAQYGGASIAADVAVVVAVMVIDVVGFVLDAAGLIRAIRVGTFVPVAIYIPAPIAVDMAAGMVRGDGTDIAADIAGGIRVIVVNVRRCINDPPCFLRAAGVGTFAPVVYAVPAPLAVVVNMGRGDGAVVAADITDVSVEGVAGLLSLGGAAGLGAELPVAGTVVVPVAIGVIGMPVAAVSAVAVRVEGMGLFIFPGGGGVGAVGVGAVTPVVGLIPAVEAFGVGVVTNGAGIAAGNAGRAGFAAVIVFFVVGNKIAITIVNIALLPMMGPTGAPLVREIVIMSPIFEAALAVVRNHAVVIRAAKDVFAAGCDRAAAGLSALLPVLVLVAEIGPEVMLAGDGADVAAGLTGGVVFAEAVGVEVLRDRAAVLRAGVPVTALVRGPDLLEIMLVVCHAAAAADAVFVIVMHRGHKNVEVDPIAVSRIPDVMRLQRPQSTAMNGQMLPDVRLVGDKEGAAGLGLQGEFGTVGLAADDGPCEDLVGDSTPSGVSRTRVLAALQPVGGSLRHCDHRGRLEAVGLSSFDDSAAFRGLDGHIEGADPGGVVTRGGDDGDIRHCVAAGAVDGLTAGGLAGGLDVDGEFFVPVMAQGGAGAGFHMGGVALTGFFHQAAFGAGGGNRFDFPIVAQGGGGYHGFVGAALPLAGGGGVSGGVAGGGGGRFQVVAQGGGHFLRFLDPAADTAGLALGQAGFGAGGGGFLDGFPIAAAVPMLIGQDDRQVFPDVIDAETPIGAFKDDLLVFIDGVAVIVAARFRGVALVVIRKAAAGGDLEGLGDAVIEIDTVFKARGGKGLGLDGDGLFREGLGLHGEGVARLVRRGHLQPDFAVVQRRQLSVRIVQLDIIQRNMDKAVFVQLAIHLIQAPAPVAVSGRKVRQIIL